MRTSHETISATTLREDSSNVLGRVRYSRERLVIEKNGKPTAALVSLDDLELLEQLEDKFDALLAQEAERSARAKGEAAIPWDEARAELGL